MVRAIAAGKSHSDVHETAKIQLLGPELGHGGNGLELVR